MDVQQFAGVYNTCRKFLTLKHRPPLVVRFGRGGSCDSIIENFGQNSKVAFFEVEYIRTCLIIETKTKQKLSPNHLLSFWIIRNCKVNRNDHRILPQSLQN